MAAKNPTGIPRKQCHLLSVQSVPVNIALKHRVRLCPPTAKPVYLLVELTVLGIIS